MLRNLRIRDERGLVHYVRLGSHYKATPVCGSRIPWILTATDAVPLSEMCPDCCALLAREGVGIRG